MTNLLPAVRGPDVGRRCRMTPMAGPSPPVPLPPPPVINGESAMQQHRDDEEDDGVDDDAVDRMTSL
jgi:hypothetical protein